MPSQESFRQAFEQTSGAGKNRLGLGDDSYVYNNESRRILYEAYESYRGFQSEKILPEHLLIGLFSGSNQVLDILEDMGYEEAMLKQNILSIFG